MISIVIITQNRKSQLKNTLDTFTKYNKKDFNVIIIDDKSNDTDGLPNYEFDIEVHKLTTEPYADYYTTAFNYGLSLAVKRSDIVIFQQGECCHAGDILSYAKTITSDKYISFGCYSLGENETPDNVVIKNNRATYNGESSWYNHPEYRRTGFPFCSALTSENLIKINGFDERFHEGIGYEDNYFVHQCGLMGLELDVTAEPFVYHQWHPATQHESWRFARNAAIFDVLVREGDYRSKHIITPDLCRE